MEFKDIGTKELKELNLYPINYFKQFKQSIEKGYFIIPSEGYRHSGKPPLLCDIARATEHDKDGEKIALNDFLQLTKEEIEKFGFSGKSIFKLLWLQKYLRGEVNGCYSVMEDSSFQSFQELSELDKKDKIIHRLNSQLEEEKANNKELRNKIDELQKEIKETNKLKLRLLNFIEENKKLLEDYSSNLN